MKILVACERSGEVRRAFRARGHETYSCDLLGALDHSPDHIQEDVTRVLAAGHWDIVIAFPPCQYLSVSGLHWNGRRRGRAALTQDAVFFFLRFTKLKCRWAIENPVGAMSRIYRKPDQIIQPYDFGEDASKKTCLWLHKLPTLTPTQRVNGRMVDGRERWANQTDSGQNKLPPSPDRAMERGITYPGIAAAMAQQWG